MKSVDQGGFMQINVVVPQFGTLTTQGYIRGKVVEDDNGDLFISELESTLGTNATKNFGNFIQALTNTFTKTPVVKDDDNEE